MLKTGPKARSIIQKWEGILDGNPATVKLDPYICPAGYWTIGWGHVVLGPNGKMLKGMANKALAYSMYPGGITLDEAKVLLSADLIKYEHGVRAICPLTTTAAQFGAMVALCFNIGIGAFQASTVARMHRLGDHAAAAAAFKSWNKATVNGRKVVLAGLTSRRADEAALYREGSQ